MIRAATPKDAQKVCEMTAEASTHEGAPPPRFTADTFLTLGFGPDRAFECYVAEVSERVVGHVSITWGFDVQNGLAGRSFCFCRPAQKWHWPGADGACLQARFGQRRRRHSMDGSAGQPRGGGILCSHRFKAGSRRRDVSSPRAYWIHRGAIPVTSIPNRIPTAQSLLALQIGCLPTIRMVRG